jgi:hypothetical protein
MSCLALLGAGLLGCSGSGSSPDASGPTYPYACQCDCIRCLTYDTTTHQCLTMGRDTFAVATCASSDSTAPAACANACAQFGTSCNTQVGSRSDAGCS